MLPQQRIPPGAHVHCLWTLGKSWQRTELTIKAGRPPCAFQWRKNSTLYLSSKFRLIMITDWRGSHWDSLNKQKELVGERAKCIHAMLRERLASVSVCLNLFSRPTRARSPAGIISIPQTEPIKSLKLLIPLLGSAFYLTHRSASDSLHTPEQLESSQWMKKTDMVEILYVIN